MLPHAPPSTGREAGAAACRAASVVPSPPTASSRSQDATSTVSAIRRGCPAIGIWPTSAPCCDAQSRIARSGPSMLRRGWPTSPSCLIASCAAVRVGGWSSLRHAFDDGGDQRLHHREHVLQVERALALLGGRDAVEPNRDAV